MTISRLTILLAVTLFTVNTFGQKSKSTKKGGCRLHHDTELDKDFYSDLDKYPEPLDKHFNVINFFVSNLKLPNKSYADDQKLRFIWLTKKDGKAEFVKLTHPANDKELEEEARRVVNLIPLHSPGRCGKESVECKNDFETPIGQLKNKK